MTFSTIRSGLAPRVLATAAGVLLLAGLTASAQDQPTPPPPAENGPVQVPGPPPGFPGQEEKAVDPAAVVATVNGETITEGDLQLAERELSQELAQVPPHQRRDAAIDALINLKLIAGAAEADGLDTQNDFQKRMEILRDRALRTDYIRNVVIPQATDEVLKKRYDEEVAKITPEDEVRASHILVETEDEAKAIIEELKGGADFAELAKAKSKDPGTGPRGGDLGFFNKGQMVKEFDEAAFTLEPGQITETPVQTQFGWHVIRVEEKRKQALPTFEEAKAQLQQLVVTEAFFSALQKMREAAEISVPERDAAGADATPKPADPAAQDGATPTPAQ